jgi:hypothetical protein
MGVSRIEQPEALGCSRLGMNEKRSDCVIRRISLIEPKSDHFSIKAHARFWQREERSYLRALKGLRA